MIAIRPLLPKDDLFIFKLLSDPLVTKHLPDTDRVSFVREAEEVLKQMIEDTQERRRFCMAVINKDYDVLMGLIIANKENISEKSMYISYELFPNHWGKGLMLEGIEKFLPLIEELFSLKKVYAQTTMDNHRSQAVLRKLGFSKKKEFLYPKPVNGRFVNAFLYSLDLPSLGKEMKNYKKFKSGEIYEKI